MVDILIRPPELRAVSEQLRASAKKIGNALQSIDAEMNSLKSQTFLGNRADTLQAHYQPKRVALLQANETVFHFAQDLQNAATAFENADRSQLNSLLPAAAGSMLGDIQFGPFTALQNLISPWSNLSLPSWLQKTLDRFFAPPKIETPLGIEKPTTGFGELLKQSPETNVAETSDPPSAQNNLQHSYSVHAASQGSLYGSAACAPTSISMVLDYYNSQNSENRTVSPEDIIKMIDKGDGTYGKGMSLSNLTDELNDLGYKNVTQQMGAKYSDLQTALEDGPVIVTAGVNIVGPGTVTADIPRAIQGAGNTIHAMVVTGIGDNQVNVNDPWSGQQMQFSKNDFEKIWLRGSSAIYSIRP